ncbi:hypothetical protein [Polaromonas sp.]|uniref:hypothetical protein n=1 Tax=Polaromonas sp. TaxID=1869339 RepID=UPI0032670601
MLTGVLGLLLLLLAGSASAQTAGFDAGNYSVKGSGGQAQLFSVENTKDKWLVKSSDPNFVMLKIVCVSGCDYLPMTEERTQQLLPAPIRQNLDMRCIANIGFALCKMTSRPLRECRDARAGESCRIGPPNAPGKPLYAMFSLFAPNVALVPLMRLDSP